MNILHIAYSLEDSSAATRLAKTQENQHRIFFLLGRLSKSNYIRKRQVNAYVGTFLGIVLHIFEIILFNFFQLKKNEVFSFGLTSAIQNLLVKRAIKVNKIDVIHLHWGGYGFFPLHAASSLDIPIVVTAHDYQFFTGGCHIPMACNQYDKECHMCPLANNRLGQRLIREIRRRNGEALKNIKPVVTAPSSYTRIKINEVHPLLNIKVVGNTLGDFYSEGELRNNITRKQYIDHRVKNNNIPTLISVGSNKSIRQNKGQDILEFVLLNLYERGIEFNYISIGVYENYKGIANRIHFDRITPRELKELYSLCDLCLVTSRFETFSQVALESVICGTPVVAFDNSGPSDIIRHGETGFLIPAFNSDYFLDAIKDNLDYKFRNIDKIYKYAIETAQRYSSSNICLSFDEVYADAIDRFLYVRVASQVK